MQFADTGIPSSQVGVPLEEIADHVWKKRFFEA
jgi:hypothetical protein